MIKYKPNTNLVGTPAYFEFISNYRIIKTDIDLDMEVCVFESKNITEIIDKKKEFSKKKKKNVFYDIEEQRHMSVLTKWERWF